ncbi:DUF4114 domain-containing protein [Mastigocoleus testarum]|uniref:DUF4114 domain-containing protein n=1 Tax=Mastigocoleus testarum BC008 TaxID=371196 RepID=A0A0V7ZJD2_9CYAN|nr:DUF4114 domain-containing protein [Mastigocoleus testarum]KST64406.1 hypothetical protein BC008_17390 [Mastigocoleus testarum BC008]
MESEIRQTNEELLNTANVEDSAESKPLSFEKIDGATGPNQTTGVFRAELSDIGFDINSIQIADSNSGQGGATGKFSGFDLDGIKISNVKIDDAQEINNIPALDVFDFSPEKTIFTPGTQRPGDFQDENLQGSLNGKLNNTFATLESFDSDGSTSSSHISLGDGGKIGFDLKKAIEQGETLYLYIGEAANNGETPEGQITVSNQSLTGGNSGGETGGENSGGENNGGQTGGENNGGENNGGNNGELTPNNQGSEKVEVELTSNNSVFIPGDGSRTRLKFNLTESNTKSVNELGVFITDNENGDINGISPGEDGYTQAALQRGQVVFSALADNGLSNLRDPREISLDGGKNLGFYFIKDGTTDQALKDLSAGKAAPNVFFDANVANPDRLDRLQISEREDGQLRLAWKENPESDNGNFDDMVVDFEVSDESPALGSNLQGGFQKEIIDLTGQEGKEIEASFEVESQAAFNNIGGLYRITDENGTVVDPLSGETFSPGDSGYTQAALRNSVVEFDRNGTEEAVTLEGGALYAPYLLANGSEDNAYFVQLEANLDGLDHVRLFGDNTFGFEDLAGIGDGDFNDMVFSVDLTVK